MCFIEDSKKQLGTVLQNRVGANEHHRKKVFTGKSMGGVKKYPKFLQTNRIFHVPMWKSQVISWLQNKFFA